MRGGKDTVETLMLNRKKQPEPPGNPRGTNRHCVFPSNPRMVEREHPWTTIIVTLGAFNRELGPAASSLPCADVNPVVPFGIASGSKYEINFWDIKAVFIIFIFCFRDHA